MAGIAVTLRRNARARRISLRVARADGAVTLTLPPGVTLQEALAFAESRAGWLLRTRAALPRPSLATFGARIPVEGRTLLVTAHPIPARPPVQPPARPPAQSRAARIEGEALLVPAAHPGPAIEAFLKHLARARLAAACLRHGAVLGRPHRALILRDTRSRWGSCTHDGRLMFSWRLAMAPPDVLDYVAAHEVAHLAHMDHSPDFWRLVERLKPGHAPHRAWLRRHGPELMAWRFRDG